MSFRVRSQFTQMSALAAGLTVLVMACKSTGNGSAVKDDTWVSGHGQVAAGYAAISQTAQGVYKAYFISSDAPGVSICFAPDQACKADPSKVLAMIPDKTTDGRPAWQTSDSQPLQEGAFMTFYVSGHTSGIEYKIQKSANGQLDPVTLAGANPGNGNGTDNGTGTGTGGASAGDPWVPNPDKVQISEVEASIIRETNMARKQTSPSLRILAVRKDLMDIARQTALYNAQNNQPNRHSGANTYENVYYAMPDAHAVVFGSSMGPGWLTHEGHRENVLNSGITAIGAAMYKAADGTPHWVEDML